MGEKMVQYMVLASSTTSHECLIGLGCGEARGLGLNVGVFS